MAGHVRKRKDRNGKLMEGWQARYPDPARPGQKVEKWFRTKAEAEAWLTLQQASVLTGSHVDPRRGDRPFQQVVDDWRASAAWAKLEPRTVQTYDGILNAYLTKQFGRYKVNAITHEAVQAYVDELRATDRSPSTVRGVYAVLRTALGRAVRQGMIRANPCTYVELPRPPRQEMHFLTQEEVAALAATITPHYRTLIYTAAYTGMRAGELGGLRRRDVDLLRGVVHVRQALKDVRGRLVFGPTKTHEHRTIVLPKFLQAMLAEHLTSPTTAPGGVGPDALVFTSTTGLLLRHGLFYKRHFKVAVAGRPATQRLPARPSGAAARKARRPIPRPAAHVRGAQHRRRGASEADLRPARPFFDHDHVRPLRAPVPVRGGGPGRRPGRRLRQGRRRATDACFNLGKALHTQILSCQATSTSVDSRTMHAGMSTDHDRNEPTGSEQTRLLRALVALVAADRDDRANDRDPRPTEYVLADAGLSTNEIAAVTGKKREAVRSALRRRELAEKKAGLKT